MAKKKQLNPETEYYVDALKIALGLDKEAMVVWNNGYMIAPTATGTVFVRCNFTCNVAVRAKDIVNAFTGCDTSFVVTESLNQVVIAWGKKKATLNSKPKISVYARDLDTLSGQQDVPAQFTQVMRECIKDLPVKSDNTFSQIIQLTDKAAYWTNRTTVAKIETGTYMPKILLWVKDLKGALTKDGDITAIFGSHSSVTFYWADGVAIQLPLVDDSAVKLPDLENFFNPELFEAEYELTEEHIDAFEFVSKFAEDVIYVEPNFVGTSEDINQGTKVDTENLPIHTQIFADSVKMGAFKNAKALVKFTDARNAIAFMTKREHFMFIFSRARRT